MVIQLKYNNHNNNSFAIEIGTTWTQEMVWCIMNNLDFKAASETNLEMRVPFFEYVFLYLLVTI